MTPCAAIRCKELCLYQMLQERRLPNAAVPDDGDVGVKLGTEIRQRRNSPILRLAAGLEAAGSDISLRQQALNDIQVIKTAALPMGSDVIGLCGHPELLFQDQ